MPTLMLLLGQYQEAYDFIKWHTKVYQESNYDYGNMELPYLDLHGADMTEDAMPVACGDVFYTSSLVYIKMVLVKAVQDAIAAHELATRASLPAELHRKLTRQMMELFSLAHTQNKHFWDAMLDPFPLIMAPEPPYYSDGDANKVKIRTPCCGTTTSISSVSTLGN
ncbi:Zinc ion binding protein [Phytophthora cinnamomi]|uniref:Zinc ion binding protein n=1 Tax=Phytophthora cinnamomi TaxID=4785 RepID=UPI00355A4363|nr:Zinc ion binding protein [Phytophthora cinnamomi]